MLISRGLQIFKAFNKLNLNPNVLKINNTKLSSTWSYRTPAPQASRKTRYTGEFVAAFVWWWILWHLWHEHEHITGEFPYPDPNQWTNEELGIPPDN